MVWACTTNILCNSKGCILVLVITATRGIHSSKHAVLLTKVSDLFCTFSSSFQVVFHLSCYFLSNILLQLFHTTQPLKCQGSRVKHMQQGLQFITPHLPDNFSLLTSLGKSYSLLYNVWVLGCLMSKVCCYWLLPLWCLSSHKTNKACLCSNMTGITAGTGRGPGIYSNYMQMDQCHVELLEQRGDSWIHVHRRRNI